MNTRLSLLMVFLKSLLPAPGASLSPGLDPRCPANTTISGDDEWANIGTLKKVTVSWGMDLFVHPDPGFKGVRLVAAGDGWQQDAWFTLDNTCFPLDARWWRLWGGVERRRNDDNNDGFLDFGVRTGDCYLRCRRTGHFLNAMNVTVVAHGPSRWTLKYPWKCIVEEYKQYRYSWINCTSHPTTTTTTTTTIAIIVVPVMIGVAVVVVLLVVLTMCYRQRRVNPDVRMRFQIAPSASEIEVVENSLYETLDNTRGTEVVENSLYETLDNTRGTEVVENSLYETLDNTRGTEVVENSLYETLDNTRGTEVVENSLYEPFENVRKPR
ncbi:uncharacterized protein LOC126993385 isoform X5 [Eriocheir sinensis]|uniref:uncharacterized protein LOC126993385 isoform X2 n=1 Tax=Eriocheir sinensis TaxID=95602 RepID=UPI0021C81AC4|nr:uncharacterized protein LOC126993385 isoform X2 [Eriocheir sinensis]XP_050708401.1 uncharacterized protein LOC126993385 isoform X3 [Eriocheir sinensis]XP_050708402.1 uncharacterized protein LOC126993385 isoform X4 [Eriocheir sinensis]XP_050708403.1 uncharacterized protein LOC126993385 isoform X5 [Eriocheir sinensis]